MMNPVASTAVESTVHGSAARIQPSYSRLTSAAMAIANGTTSEEKPVNRTGGWIVIQGSWSSGFKPFPSAGACPAGKVRNGPRITVTSPSIISGRFRKNIDVVVSEWRTRSSTIPSVQVMSPQSRNVPSWPPQNAANT